jgi:putative transposase
MPLISFKTELKLNNQQKTMMAKHAGVARHAYNWGFATCLKALENNEKLPTSIDLHKKLVAEVKTVFPWYYEVSKCAPQEALRNLNTAFKNWWVHKHTSSPRFKKKGHKDSFYLEGAIKISGNRIKLPRIGWVNVYEILPAITPKNVTISRHADRWFISFKYELDIPNTRKIRKTLGVDLGINSLATCSDGTVFENRKAYRKNQRKLARLQRNLSRKEKGSKNRQKARIKLAKQHKKVKQIRIDSIHKLTSWLAKNHSEIVIENLNVSGMLKNHRLASAIADCGFYEFKRQLEYKTRWYGSKLIIADRFYPSSQLCSNCQNRQKMPLNKRVYECSHCGLKIDRDLNASINLELYPTTCSEHSRTTDSSSGSKACEELNQLSSKSIKDSLKQEVNIHPMKSGDLS